MAAQPTYTSHSQALVFPLARFCGHSRRTEDNTFTVEQARALANWIAAKGKNLTTIYATHGHGDHFFGTSTVLERFPGTGFVARPEVIKIMRQQASPESLATFWKSAFSRPDFQPLAIAEELTGNVINLEGQDLVSVPLGFTALDKMSHAQ